MTTSKFFGAPARVQAGSGSADPAESLTTVRQVLEDILRPLRLDIQSIKDTLTARRKDYLTVDEIAELTGRSAFTVRRWISQKRINAIRVAGSGPKGRLLIPRAEIDVLLTSALGSKIPASACDPPSPPGQGYS